MDHLQQVEIVQSDHRRHRIFLLQDQTQFGKDTPTAQRLEEVHAHGIDDQVGGQFADFEPETLFEPQGAEYPCGILNQAQIMQQPDGFFFEVLHGREKVDQGAELPGVELDGQGVDGKIAPEQVELD